MKLNKTLITSSFLFLILLLVTPVVNYFYGSSLIETYLNSKYLVHFVIANSELTIDQVTNGAVGVILVRDGFVLITSAWFQILFIITTLILIKRKKGLINFLLSFIFAVLSLVGVVALVYLYYTLEIAQSFFTYQTYFLLAIAITNFIIYLFFSYYFIKSRYNAIMPLTELTFLRAVYYLIRLVAIIVIILSGLILVNGIIFDNFINYVVSQINVEDILNLPSIVRLDLISTLDAADSNFSNIINALTYKQGMFEVLNGELIIHISQLSTSIQTFINSYVDMYYEIFLTFTLKYVVIFIVLQVLNYIHKSLDFKNIISQLLLVALAITTIIVLPTESVSLLVSLKVFIIVLIIIYTLLFIDVKVADYKITRKICDFINNFTLNDSLKSFITAVGQATKELKKRFDALMTKAKRKPKDPTTEDVKAVEETESTDETLTETTEDVKTVEETKATEETLTENTEDVKAVEETKTTEETLTENTEDVKAVEETESTDKAEAPKDSEVKAKSSKAKKPTTKKSKTTTKTTKKSTSKKSEEKKK